MRVLITGTSGHVGSAIATHLINEGWEVVGLSRTPSRLRGIRQDVQADLRMASFTEEVATTVSPCEAIVHAAATLDKDLYTSEIPLTNCLGTQQALRLADIWQVSNFVYISSVAVIGAPQHLPVTEDHPVDPRTAYHASKVFGEHLTLIARRDGLAGSILRLTSPVGPRMPDNRILSVFVKRALANQPLLLTGMGTRRQNYVDVRDIAIAVEQCLQMRVTGIFNIASRHSFSNRELAEACVNTLSSSSRITFSGQPDPEEGIVWEISIEKAGKYFHYDPQYGIEESIRAIGAEYAAGSN